MGLDPSKWENLDGNQYVLQVVAARQRIQFGVVRNLYIRLNRSVPTTGGQVINFLGLSEVPEPQLKRKGSKAGVTLLEPEYRVRYVQHLVLPGYSGQQVWRTHSWITPTQDPRDLFVVAYTATAGPFIQEPLVISPVLNWRTLPFVTSPPLG